MNFTFVAKKKISYILYFIFFIGFSYLLLFNDKLNIPFTFFFFFFILFIYSLSNFIKNQLNLDSYRYNILKNSRLFILLKPKKFFSNKYKLTLSISTLQIFKIYNEYNNSFNFRQIEYPITLFPILFHYSKVNKFPLLKYRTSIYSILILLSLFFFRFYIIEAFKIPSGSMIPTVLIGDNILASKFNISLNKKLKRHFFFIFSSPIYSSYNQKQSWIKKNIFWQGESFSFLSKKQIFYYIQKKNIHNTYFLNVSSTPNNEIWIKKKNIKLYNNIKKSFLLLYESFNLRFFNINWYLINKNIINGIYSNYKYSILQNKYTLVCGDNRNFSSDGRIWGPLSFSKIYGSAIFLWISYNHSKFFHHIKFLYIVSQIRLNRIF